MTHPGVENTPEEADETAAGAVDAAASPLDSPEEIGSWTAVAPALEPPAAPPIPAWAKAVAGALGAVLVVCAAWLGATLGARPAPAGSESPNGSASPRPSGTHELAAPVQIGDFVRGTVTESDGPGPDQRLLRADYSDGTDRVLLILTRPVANLQSFVTDAGVEGAKATSSDGGTLCGTSLDTLQPACGRVKGDTGILVAAVGEQPQTELATLTRAFERAITTS